MIAGVLTAGELALLRTRPQRTQLYLAIPEYNTIYTALVNGTPADNDNTVTVAFNGGAGVLTDIKKNMLLMVGSAAGAWDVGMARIRKDGQLGDTSFSIGITSDIDFANGQFLTIVDDFSLWPIHPYIDPVTEVPYMDYDIAYVEQNEYGKPVPIIGTHIVLELTGATVTTNFDASDSYSCLGGVPSFYTYAWTCPGAVVDTPAWVDTDITFNAAGTYLVGLTLTSHWPGGHTASITTYRYAIVYDAANPLNSSFTLDSCSGDFESGNWSYGITMRANATQSDVRDRTLCLLVARDWYGTTEQSIGPLSGRENIVCVGWIDGDSITRSNDTSSVSFEVQGPTFWLGVQEGFPTGVDDTTVVPVDWLHIQDLTPYSGIYHFLSERTTAPVVMDCYITSDNHKLATTYTPSGSLLEQLRAICQKINARTVCDRYGRLFCEIDTQFIAPASRTFPVVQTLTDRDWREEIEIERREVSPISQVDLSGVYFSGDFTTSAAYFALAPGHYPKHYGTKTKIERIALDDQAEANSLAGYWLGYLTNEFPNIDVSMSSVYRAVDIAPRMFVQMNMAAGDTPRGITWTNKKLIPRRVEFEHDNGEALMLTNITFEAETFASEAVIGDPPPDPPPPVDPPDPPPPVPPPDPITLDIVVTMTNDYIAYSDDVFTNVTAGTPTLITWTDITPAGSSGKLRDFVVADTGELWVAMSSTPGDAFEGIWYTADITTTPLARILATATALTDSGYSAGSFEQYSLCLVAGECYAVLQNITPVFGSANIFYWHGNGAMAAGNHDQGAFFNLTLWGTGCTDGVTANYGWSRLGGGLRVINLIGGATAGDVAAGGDALIISENYVLNSVLTKITLLPEFQIATYTNASANLPLVEKDAKLYWYSTLNVALMQDAIVQAIPNDSGGTLGVFSNAGASAGGYSCGDTYATIFWAANSAHAVNAYRDIAMTDDGGFTWHDITGDWNTSVAAYDGGGTVVVLIKWAAVLTA